MFEDVTHYFRILASLENKNSSKNINGLQEDSPKIQEQITDQIEEQEKFLYKADELKKDVRGSICECYPHIKNLSVDIVPSKNYIGNGKYLDRYYLNVSWNDGICECRVNSIVDCALNDYFDYTHGEVPRSILRVQLRRIFTDSIVLRECRKYANCIAPNLPLNMHNVHCFKLGGVPIYDLAIGELLLIDEIKP